MSKVLVIKGADFSENALGTIEFDVVHCTGISLVQSSLSFTEIGATAAIVANVTPLDCEESIYWASSNTSCCTVDESGYITVVGVGSAVITATCGQYSATCSVAVEVEADVQRQKNGAADPGNATNNYTKLEAFDNTQSWQSTRMVMFDYQTSADELIVGYNLVTYADNAASLPSWADSTNVYVGYCESAGMTNYPIPIRLPNGCTKVRTETPLTGYGSRVLWFKKDVRCSNSSSTGTQLSSQGYFNAYRDLAAMNANYAWQYNSGETFNVPEGYDSCIIVWQSNGTAQSFKDMADADVAKFKAYFL